MKLKEIIETISSLIKEIDKVDLLNSDVVIGSVANDRTMPVIKLYFSGIYDEAETIKRPLPQKLKDQYAFKSEKALKALVLSEVIE